MSRKIKWVIAASLVAIAIMAAAQVFLIRKILELQNRSFDYQYSEVLNRAVDLFDYSQSYHVFGKAEKLMQSSSAALIGFSLERPFLDSTLFRKLALESFHQSLVEQEELSALLRMFLERSGHSTEFTSWFVISYLDLIHQGQAIPVFREMPSAARTYPDTLKIPSSALRANHYTYERDLYRIEFDFLVDFSDKSRMVWKQATGSLTLSVAAILLVGFVFFLTLRNLLEEQRLSQSKTDFINNMTHELKTPLSTISIATKTLESEQILSSREKILHTAGIIQRQNRQLSRQINHLLEISMWEKRQFDLDRRELELETYFKGLVDGFRLECRERDFILTEHFEFDRKTAWMDETQMTVALHNLLSNAMKYNNQVPEIELRVKSGTDLTVVVADNGIGIQREHQKHVFEKFYRVPTGNIHKVKGLGLGLFYVRQIVEAHGGTIDLVSHPGQGSRFTIKIPTHGKNQSSAGRG